MHRLRRDLPLLAAMENWVFSTQRRITRSNWGLFLEPIEVHLSWFPIARFARARVDLCGDFSEAFGTVKVQIGPLGKVLADESVGVRIGH